MKNSLYWLVSALGAFSERLRQKNSSSTDTARTTATVMEAPAQEYRSDLSRCQAKLVNAIAAVVNDEFITLYEIKRS
jgi:hypothetical protein